MSILLSSLPFHALKFGLGWYSMGWEAWENSGSRAFLLLSVMVSVVSFLDKLRS